MGDADAPVGGDQPTDDMEFTGEVIDDDVEVADPVGTPGAEVSFEELIAERDGYLDALMRLKAEFDNHRKRVERERQALTAQVSARLVGELLAVLDSCEAAIVQGSTDVEPIYKSLLELLGKEGLEVMPSADVAFDPHLHEAVIHEPGDSGETMVSETLRTGYVWQGTVLRPAMVKVRG